MPVRMEKSGALGTENALEKGVSGEEPKTTTPSGFCRAKKRGRQFLGKIEYEESKKRGQ